MDQGKVVTGQEPQRYGFSVALNEAFDRVVQRVVDALKSEGFGVLADIDVQGTMKAKLGVDMRPYRILGACNPQLAQQAIETEPDIGLLLPCNVIVREEADGRVTVGFMDPVAVLAMVNNPGITKLGWDVRGRLERVRDMVKAG